MLKSRIVDVGRHRYSAYFALIILTLFLCLLSVAAQTPGEDIGQKPKPIKVSEVGALEACEFRDGVRRFMTELSNKPRNQGYIINYGTDHEISRRERWITGRINFRHFDRSRITLVRGGSGRNRLPSYG